MATIVEIQGRPVNADSPARDIQPEDIIKNPGAIEGYPVSKSSAGDISEDERVILADTGGGAFTLTIPSDQPQGRVFILKNIGSSANDLTVDTNDSATIDGSASVAVSDGEVVKLIADADGNFYDIS